MKKLWQKTTGSDGLVESYTSGENVGLDNKLIVWDAIGSIAHGKMLARIGILTVAEFGMLQKELVQIITMAENGQFTVEFGDEDVHTKIENYLTEKLGDVGKKIHTGRSRNDQILVDLRLFGKNELLKTAQIIMEVVGCFLTFAKQYEFVPMPGYTHMQKAMPSSVGVWAGSFVESLLDDFEVLKNAYLLNDQNPLGSGAAYGVSLPLDRELTTDLLGFSKTQNNVLYCQVSRPKIQIVIMHALAQIMLTLSRFAGDLLLFTTSEFDFFEIPAGLCTGSSIMPQKKNVDIMEIARARTHQVASCMQTVVAIGAGLPSGYNSDFQETKKPFMEALDTVCKTLEIVALTVKSIKPKEENLLKACTPELTATHAAYLLVKKGMPFRDAYQAIGAMNADYPKFDIHEVLKQTDHTGAPGNLQLEKTGILLEKEKNWWNIEQQKFIGNIGKLKGGNV